MKQKIYKVIFASIAFLSAVNFVFSAVQPVLAADKDVNDLWGGQQAKQYVQDNSGLPAEPNTDPRIVAVRIIRVVLSFLGIIALIIVLYAGFKWMTSRGNEETIGDAKKILTAGLIGLIIILSAYIIANFVINHIYGAANGWQVIWD